MVDHQLCPEKMYANKPKKKELSFECNLLESNQWMENFLTLFNSAWKTTKVCLKRFRYEKLNGGNSCIKSTLFDVHNFKCLIALISIMMEEMVLNFTQSFIFLAFMLGVEKSL